MTRKMIIDTDTASDDAVALIMALQAEDVKVLAITIVSGNVGVKQGSTNARFVVELCGQDTPVYEGAHHPLVRERYDARWFHGQDGLGDIGYPKPQRPPAAGHAVEALIHTIRANPGVLLVTLGPLTNIALAVSQAPDIVSNVSCCIVMGGAACTVGNITPAAEYNIWCDPEAASIVFRSELPMEMVGWELCRGAANLSADEMNYYKNVIDTPLSHFVIDCNAHALRTNQEWLSDPGIGLPDPVAMAIALEPQICTRKSQHYVAIECEGTYTRGMTVVDELHVAGYQTSNVAVWEPQRCLGVPNISVCWEIDIPRWKALLKKTVS